MTETMIGERATTKEEQGGERIAEQARSGLSVKQFCKSGFEKPRYSASLRSMSRIMAM